MPENEEQIKKQIDLNESLAESISKIDALEGGIAGVLKNQIKSLKELNTLNTRRLSIEKQLTTAINSQKSRSKESVNIQKTISDGSVQEAKSERLLASSINQLTMSFRGLKDIITDLFALWGTTKIVDFSKKFGLTKGSVSKIFVDFSKIFTGKMSRKNIEEAMKRNFRMFGKEIEKYLSGDFFERGYFKYKTITERLNNQIRNITGPDSKRGKALKNVLDAVEEMRKKSSEIGLTKTGKYIWSEMALGFELWKKKNPFGWISNMLTKQVKGAGGIPPVIGELGTGRLGTFFGAGGGGGRIGSGLAALAGGAAGGFRAIISLMGGPLTIAITAIVALITKLVLLFNSFDSAAARFRMNMGFLAKYSYQITQQGAQVFRQWAVFGAQLEDSLESFQAISSTIGTTNASTGMVSQMILFNKQLGIGYNTSSQFLLSMSEIGRTTMDNSTNMLNAIGRLSQEKMVNLSTAMEDINESMKSSFALMRQTPMALIKAAIAARQMGTNLQSTANTAQSVLQFTSSVQKEMEASVLLGKAVNLQRLRELSYTGDLAGAQEEILKIAQESHFEQLDFFQKQALAAALNKQPEELERMLVARRQQLALGKSIVQIQKEEYDNQLKTRANQSTLTQLGNAWANVWVELAPTMLQLAEILRGMIPALNWLVNSTIKFEKAISGPIGFLYKLGSNPLGVGVNMWKGIGDKVFGTGGNIEKTIVPQVAQIVNTPSITTEKLQPEFNSTQLSSAFSSNVNDGMDKLSDKLDQHTDAIKALHKDLKEGGISAYASISMDGTKLDSSMARKMSFMGPRSPQPAYS